MFPVFHRPIEFIATFRFESRDVHSLWHFELFKNLASTRIDSAQFALHDAKESSRRGQQLRERTLGCRAPQLLRLISDPASPGRFPLLQLAESASGPKGIARLGSLT